MNTYYIYIMTNQSRSVLYIGVTNDLTRRVAEHQSGMVEGFTKRYRVHTLIYFEMWSNIEDAIKREKQLKRWRREKKEALIETINPEWRDLAEE